MKPREQRQRVTLSAQMRTEAGWTDVTIRDISPHGLGLRCARPPRRGDYVELCRHHHKLIGRVMWSEGEWFGVRLSEPIVIDDLLSSRPVRPRAEERRLRARRRGSLHHAHDPRGAIASMEQSSQHASRLMHFAAITAIACIGAALAADLAGSLLSQAMDAVSEGLVAGRAEASPN